MTRRSWQAFSCAQCGQESEHIVILSTNTFGTPDLDLRPARMKRDTMDCWVQECPHCRYVAQSLDDKTPGAQEVTEGQDWARLTEKAAVPLHSRGPDLIPSHAGQMNVFQRRRLLAL